MRLFLWDQMERFDLVPACQIPSRSTVSPIHMHTSSKQPGTMQKNQGGGKREGERIGGCVCVCMHVKEQGGRCGEKEQSFGNEKYLESSYMTKSGQITANSDSSKPVKF